jgi:hypothetical protein
MSRKLAKFAVSFSLCFLSTHALGADPPMIALDAKEAPAYCTYVMEQSHAEQDLLRTPVGVAGMTQPETGLPLQFVAGASVSLSNLKKAGLTLDAAHKDCALYRAATGTQQSIQYAQASLEQRALRNRLALIDQASKSLDELMQKTSKMIEAHTATHLMLFSLQTTRIKLDADRSDTQSKITALYVPPLTDKPLKEQVAEKQSSEVNEQMALARLNRQNSWDVALSLGVHQQINPIAFGAQPYGAVSVNYNFASWAIDKHLDNAVAAHEEWKKVQESDVVRSMQVLRQQLVESISVQQTRLHATQEESEEIDRNLQLVLTPDTSAALDFHNQLAAAKLLLQIETGDAQFRINHLREYLERNY